MLAPYDLIKMSSTRIHRKKSTQISPGNLIIENFSERNIDNQVGTQQIKYFLNRMDFGSEKDDKNEFGTLKHPKFPLINLQNLQSDVSQKNQFGSNNRTTTFEANFQSVFSERSALTDRKYLELLKGKSDLNTARNSDRRGGILDLKKMKTEYVTKQRKYLIKKTEYRNKNILPKLPSEFETKESNENWDREDVYEEMNPIYNQQEFVKKYLINKDQNSKSSNKIVPTVIKNSVRLQDLIPKSKSILKRGFTIRFEKKGNEFVYQLVKEGKIELNKNKTATSQIYKLQKEYSSADKNLTSRTRNKMVISTGDLKKSSSLGFKNPMFTGSNHFRRTLAKHRQGGQIEGHIFKQIGKLNEVRSAIHETFNQAMNDLYMKEGVEIDD